MDPVRIVVVDDHPLFRDGLSSSLRALPGAEVVAEAASGVEAVEVALRLQPDVVLMDLHMPDMNGIEATRRIVEASPTISVLVLTMLEDDASVFAAMRAGAPGYLVKGADRREICHALEAIAHGEIIFGPAVANRVLGFFALADRRSGPVGVQAFPTLTDREREILELIASGLSNPAITSRLILSPKTVRNHVSNVIAKLHAADRAAAITMARDAGYGQKGI